MSLYNHQGSQVNQCPPIFEPHCNGQVYPWTQHQCAHTYLFSFLNSSNSKNTLPSHLFLLFVFGEFITVWALILKLPCYKLWDALCFWPSRLVWLWLYQLFGLESFVVSLSSETGNLREDVLDICQTDNPLFIFLSCIVIEEFDPFIHV